MTQREGDFLKTLRNYIIAGVVSIVISSAVAGTVFYFNTKSAVAQNRKDINNLIDQKADKSLYELQVYYINEHLKSIDESLKEIKNQPK